MDNLTNSFPVSPLPQASPSSAGTSRDRLGDSVKKHCLLVVDDEPDVCDSVRDLLRREFRVLVANSVAEGYQILLREEVHIIMTDQRMPEISGVEFLAGLAVKHPKAIRVLFTGYADLDSVIAAINQGHVYQFLKKPWNPNDLVEAMRSASREYERLVETQTETARLKSEISDLKERVSTLETEIQRFRPQ